MKFSQSMPNEMNLIINTQQLSVFEILFIYFMKKMKSPKKAFRQKSNNPKSKWYYLSATSILSFQTSGQNKYSFLTNNEHEMQLSEGGVGQVRMS